MKFQWNVIALVFLVFVSINLIVGSASKLVFVPGFEALEKKSAHENLHRVQNALQEEIAHLSKETADEAFWDATYEFIENRHSDYIESDMAGLEDLDIDLGLFLTLTGDVVYGEIAEDLPGANDSALAALQRYFINKPSLWRHQSTESHVDGILVSPSGPLMFSSRPILTSESEGPINGALIFGRFLNSVRIESLAKRTELAVTINPYDPGQKMFRSPADGAVEAGATTAIKLVDNQTLESSLLLSDVEQAPALVLTIQMARDIVVQGKAIIDSFLLWLFYGSMIFSLFVYWLLHGWYSSRAVVVRGIKKYKELSNHFQTLLNAIPDNLVVLSPELEIVWCNRSFIDDAVNFKSDPIGHHCFEARGETSRRCDPCLALDCFATGKEENCLLSLPEGRSVGKRYFPIKDQGGCVVNVIELSHDITERVNAQTETIRARQLASLGELAAGVAHEVNNPLNGVINYAQILINKATRENRDADIPERIVAEGNRIAEIVSQLLVFSREPDIQKTPTDLRIVLNNAISLMASHLHNDGIKIKTNLPPDLPLVPVVSQRIQQVFLNLLINSRDALNEKARVGEPGKQINIKAEKKDDEYVRISFHDNGAGIPEKLLENIMNPFFTTKAANEGTGLGLSVSHSIIKQHQGMISFESIVDEFTRVTVDIPLNAS